MDKFTDKIWQDFCEENTTIKNVSQGQVLSDSGLDQLDNCDNKSSYWGDFEEYIDSGDKEEYLEAEGEECIDIITEDNVSDSKGAKDEEHVDIKDGNSDPVTLKTQRFWYQSLPELQKLSKHTP